MARLIVEHHGEVRREIELGEAALIGRDADADVLIGDPASRQHARIEREGRAFVLRDLNSKAGTFVDGRKVSRIHLTDGTKVTIGDYALIFSDPPVASDPIVAWAVDGDPSPLDVVAAVDASVPPFFQRIGAARAGAEAERLRGHLRTIHDIGRAISSKHDVDSVLHEVAERLSEVFPAAQRGFLALCDRPGAEPTVRVLKMSGTESAADLFSRTIARRAMESRQSILCKDAREEFKSSASVQDLTLGSVMCVPLLLPDRTIGILQWDSRGATGVFSTEDLNLLTGIASMLAMALENARLCDNLRAVKALTEAENVRLRRADRQETSLASILGDSEGIREARRLAQQMMRVRTSVLITGETGSGKELLAQAIHFGGPRAGKPCIAVNCAAIPEGLLESELFGIEKGVATGVDAHTGKFEQAHGGTLFLDEVGDMGLPMQAKLLRALEEGRIERVGGKDSILVDTRVIAATHRDLRAAIRDKEFREDLYYRLRVVEIHIPPLRERGKDVLALAHHYLALFASDMGKSLRGFTPAAEERLLRHPWPGNVRELRNAIERAAALAQEDEVIDLDLLPPEVAGQEADLVGKHRQYGRLDAAVAALEREMIEAALRETGGNRTKAAERLGISREGLRQKLVRYGISV